MSQANINVDRLQQELQIIGTTLEAAQLSSSRSSEGATLMLQDLDALLKVQSVSETSLDQAQFALQSANEQIDDIAASAALVEAYETVLQNAQSKFSELQAVDDGVQTTLLSTQSIHAIVETAAESANLELQDAITAAEDGSSTEANVALEAARGAALKAERDLLIANIDLAIALSATTNSATDLTMAIAELESTTLALTVARAEQLSAVNAKKDLQGAQLLLSANLANLELISQRQVQVEQETNAVNEQADADLLYLGNL